MAKAGIIQEDERVELIEGEIVKMSPIGKQHAGIVNRLTALLHALLATQAVIAVQNPILLSDDSEPQPDIAVLRFRDDYYASKLPTPDDVLLLIEVADTSVADDHERKLPLYARSAISQVWLVNLPEGRIEVHSNPFAGEYRGVRHWFRGESLPLPIGSATAILVDAILG